MSNKSRYNPSSYSRVKTTNCVTGKLISIKTIKGNEKNNATIEFTEYIISYELK